MRGAANGKVRKDPDTHLTTAGLDVANDGLLPLMDMNLLDTLYALEHKMR
jgi:hypothetical protein